MTSHIIGSSATMILLSNFRFSEDRHEFKAEGFCALLEIAYHARLILLLVVVLSRVAVLPTIHSNWRL